MKTAILGIIFAPLLLAFTCCTGLDELHSQIAYRRGLEDGKKELKNGTLAVESYGLPAPWAPQYRRILKDRYGIEERRVAGCIVDGGILGHAEGFNSVMKQASKERFGKDVFKEAAAEARAEYKMKNAEQAAASGRDKPPV